MPNSLYSPSNKMLICHISTSSVVTTHAINRTLNRALVVIVQAYVCIVKCENLRSKRVLTNSKAFKLTSRVAILHLGPLIKLAG